MAEGSPPRFHFRRLNATRHAERSLMNAPRPFVLTPGEPAGIGPDLCLLLARYCDDGRREITIPGLRDMAAITNLTEETVSRAMSRLRRLGILQRQDRRHGRMLVAAEPAAA